MEQHHGGDASISVLVHPGSFQPACYSHRSATSDLLGAYCTAVQLNGLLLGLSRSLFSHTTHVCVVPVSLIYVTRLPRSIMQQAAPVVRSLGGKMRDTVTDVRSQSAPLH